MVFELIDTLWNVNKICAKWHKKIKKELIDTLWNVNRVVKIDLILCIKELIDTLWNVNKLVYTISGMRVPRINRYIMECKFKKM